MTARIPGPRQPREHPVMCIHCGTHRGQPTMTWNTTGLCDRHEDIERLVDAGWGWDVDIQKAGRRRGRTGGAR